MNRLLAAISALEVDRDDFEKQAVACQATVEDEKQRCAQQSSETQRTRDELLETESRLHSSLEEIETLKAWSATELDQERQRCRELAERIQALEEQWENRDEAVIDFSSEATLGRDLVNALNNKVEQLNAALEDSMTKLADQHERQSSAEEALRAAQQFVDQATNQTKSKEMEIQQLKNENRKLQEMNQASKETIMDLEGDSVRAQSVVDTLKDEISRLQKGNFDLQEALESKKGEVQQQKDMWADQSAKVKRLELALEESRSASAVVEKQRLEFNMSSSSEAHGRALRLQLLAARSALHAAAASRRTSKSTTCGGNSSNSKRRQEPSGRGRSSSHRQRLATGSEQSIFVEEEALLKLGRCIRSDEDRSVDESEGALIAKKTHATEFDIAQVMRRHRLLALKYFMTDWRTPYRNFCDFLSSGSSDSYIAAVIREVENRSKDLNPIEWGCLYFEFLNLLNSTKGRIRQEDVDQWQRLSPTWKREPWIRVDAAKVLDNEQDLASAVAAAGFRNVLLENIDRIAKSKLQNFVSEAKTHGIRVALQFRGYRVSKSDELFQKALAGDGRALSEFIRCDGWRAVEASGSVEGRFTTYCDPSGAEEAISGENRIIPVASEHGLVQLWNNVDEEYVGLDLGSPVVFLRVASELVNLVLECGASGICLPEVSLWFRRLYSGGQGQPELVAFTTMVRMLLSSLSENLVLICDGDEQVGELVLPQPPPADLVCSQKTVDITSYQTQSFDPRLSDAREMLGGAFVDKDPRMDSILAVLMLSIHAVPLLRASEIAGVQRETWIQLNEMRRDLEQLRSGATGLLQTRSNEKIAFVRYCSKQVVLVCANLGDRASQFNFSVAELLVKFGVPAGEFSLRCLHASHSSPTVEMEDQKVMVWLESHSAAVFRVDVQETKVHPERRIQSAREWEQSNRESGPTVLPTIIQWDEGGSSVDVLGSFNSWTLRYPLLPLSASGKFASVLYLPSDSSFECKFIRDGEWMCSRLLPRAGENNAFTVRSATDPLPLVSEQIMSPWHEQFLRGAQALPRPPTSDWLRPVVFLWVSRRGSERSTRANYGDGDHEKVVCLSGSFDGWKERYPMCRSQAGGYWWTVVNLAVGLWHYRFAVDGQWAVSDDQPKDVDGSGFESNVMIVA